MRAALTDILNHEPVRFVITGIAAAALLAILTFAALRSPLPPFAGTLLAYGITVVASYTTQQAWTFRGRHGHGRAFPRYCAAQLLCAGLTAGLAQALVHAGLAPATTAIVTTVVGSAASYTLSRFWVFPAGRGRGVKRTHPARPGRHRRRPEGSGRSRPRRRSPCAGYRRV